MYLLPKYIQLDMNSVLLRSEVLALGREYRVCESFIWIDPYLKKYRSKEVIHRVAEDKVPKLLDVRGKVQEVLTVRQLFNPMIFVMHKDVLCYKRHTHQTNQSGSRLICIPEAKIKEAFKICHGGITSRHRGVNGTF